MRAVLAILLFAAAVSAEVDPLVLCQTTARYFQGNLSAVMEATTNQTRNDAAANFSNLFTSSGNFFDPLFDKPTTTRQTIETHVAKWYAAHPGCKMKSTSVYPPGTLVGTLGYKFTGNDPVPRPNGRVYCGVPLKVTLELTPATGPPGSPCLVNTTQTNQYTIVAATGLIEDAYVIYNVDQVIPELTVCTQRTCTA